MAILAMKTPRRSTTSAQDWDYPRRKPRKSCAAPSGEGSSPPRALFDAVRNFPKVTIAQIHGYCLGGGLALMNSHDLVIAARNATKMLKTGNIVEVRANHGVVIILDK